MSQSFSLSLASRMIMVSSLFLKPGVVMGLMVKPPYRSVAGALLLVLFLGPLGAFYSSLIGGVVCTLLGLAAIGMVMSQSSPLPLCTVWLISLVWAMISVRWYNRTLWKTVLAASGYHELNTKPFSFAFRKKKSGSDSDE